MIDALKRTLVGTVDLSEQAKSPYVLIVGGAVGRAYYYVDSWEQDGDNMVFYKNKTYTDALGEKTIANPVYMCRQEGMWGIIHADLVELFTNEDLIRTSKRESDQVEALHKELEPAPPAQTDGAPEHQGMGIYL